MAYDDLEVRLVFLPLHSSPIPHTLFIRTIDIPARHPPSLFVLPWGPQHASTHPRRTLPRAAHPPRFAWVYEWLGGREKRGLGEAFVSCFRFVYLLFRIASF